MSGGKYREDKLALVRRVIHNLGESSNSPSVRNEELGSRIILEGSGNVGLEGNNNVLGLVRPNSGEECCVEKGVGKKKGNKRRKEASGISRAKFEV